MKKFSIQKFISMKISRITILFTDTVLSPNVLVVSAISFLYVVMMLV